MTQFAHVNQTREGSLNISNAALTGAIDSTNVRSQFDAYMAKAKRNPLLDRDTLNDVAREAYSHQYQIILLLSQFTDCSRSAIEHFRFLLSRNHKLVGLSKACCDQSLIARDALYELNKLAGKGSAKDDASAPERVHLTLETLESLLDELDSETENTLAKRHSLVKSISHTYSYINLRNDEFEKHCDLFKSNLETVSETSEILCSILDSADFERVLESFSESDIERFSGFLPDHDQLSFRTSARKTVEILDRNVLSMRQALSLQSRYDHHHVERQKHISKITESNLLLAAKQTLKSRPNDERLFDLCQEASQGLIVAANRYSYWLGYAFSTYAVWWIDQRLDRHRDQFANGSYSIPISIVTRSHHINTLLREDTSDSPKPLSTHQLAQRLGCDAKKIDEAKQAYAPCVPGFSSDEGFSELLCNASSAEELVVQENLRDVVHRALSTLPPNKMLVCKMLWGIDQPKQKLADAAKLMGLTTERVRAIGAEGIEILKTGEFADDLYDLYNLA